jgi:hypothetical protein
MCQHPNKGLQYFCLSGYKGPQTSQQTPLSMPKYYVAKAIDPKLFMMNPGNIPQGY